MKEVEQKPLDTSNVLIWRKWSALEWFMQKNNLTFEQALADYAQKKINTTPILEGHQQQLDTVEKVSQILGGKATIVAGEEIDPEILKQSTTRVILGGDNFIQNVAHYLEDQPVLFINPDPDRSNGALAAIDSSEIDKYLPRILKGGYKIEEWTRLQAVVHKLESKESFEFGPPAISEILFANNEPDEMTKYILYLKGREQKLNDSGLIVATGRGTSGWFDSASKYVFFAFRLHFSPKEKKAIYVAREFFPKKTAKTAKKTDTFGLEDELRVKYLSYGSGRVSVDSKVRYKDIQMGDEVSIHISDKPLNVIRLDLNLGERLIRSIKRNLA